MLCCTVCPNLIPNQLLSVIPTMSSPAKTMKFDISSIDDHISKLNSVRGHFLLTKEEKWEILRVFFVCEKEALESNRATSNSYRRTSQYFGRSTRTVQTIVKSWLATTENELSSTNELQVILNSNKNNGNTTLRPARLPNTLICHALIRDFVRICRIKRQRVTARQILDFLVKRNWFVYLKMRVDVWRKKTWKPVYVVYNDTFDAKDF